MHGDIGLARPILGQSLATGQIWGLSARKENPGWSGQHNSPEKLPAQVSPPLGKGIWAGHPQQPPHPPTPFRWEAPRPPARCPPQTHHSQFSSSPVCVVQDPGLHMSPWRPREGVLKEQQSQGQTPGQTSLLLEPEPLTEGGHRLAPPPELHAGCGTCVNGYFRKDSIMASQRQGN